METSDAHHIAGEKRQHRGLHMQAYEPGDGLLALLTDQAVQAEIDLLTVPTRLHGTLQGPFHGHVAWQGR